MTGVSAREALVAALRFIPPEPQPSVAVIWTAILLCRDLDSCRRVLASEAVSPSRLDPDVAVLVLGRSAWPWLGDAPGDAAWLGVPLGHLAAASGAVEEAVQRHQARRRAAEFERFAARERRRR